jgi:hypothetical protein
VHFNDRQIIGLMQKQNVKKHTPPCAQVKRKGSVQHLATELTYAYRFGRLKMVWVFSGHRIFGFSMSMSDVSSGAAFSRPFVVQTPESKTLHFSEREIQSRMSLLNPDALDIEYTRMIMGFLVFNSAPKQILMIGLGGGSLPKFCYRYLPGTDIEVVEIDPAVIALRDTFSIPQDNERFRVV